MGKILIPIGMSMGPNMTSPTEGTFDVLVGDDMKEYTADEWLIWGMAHDNHQAHYEHRFDRDALRTEVDKVENAVFDDDLRRMIDKFIADGAMEEIDLKNDPLEPFFRKYTIVPTARSHGNGVDDQDLFGIGNDKEPEIWFTGWSQMIWAASHISGSMWSSCEQLAAASSDATALEAAADFAKTLPVIVATQCGFLEPAR